MDVDLLPNPIDQESAILLSRYLAGQGKTQKEIVDEINKRGYETPTSHKPANVHTVNYLVNIAPDNSTQKRRRIILNAVKKDTMKPELLVYSTEKTAPPEKTFETHPESQLEQEAAIDLAKDMYTAGRTVNEIIAELDKRGYRSARSGRPANKSLVEYLVFRAKEEPAERAAGPTQPAGNGSKITQDEAIKLAGERRDQGKSYSEIAAELHRRGYITATGRKPTDDAVRYLHDRYITNGKPRPKKSPSGKVSRITEDEALEIVREMHARGTGYAPIVAALRKAGYVTAAGCSDLKKHHISYLASKVGAIKSWKAKPSILKRQPKPSPAATTARAKHKREAPRKEKHEREPARQSAKKDEAKLIAMQEIAAMQGIPAKYRKEIIAKMLMED